MSGRNGDNNNFFNRSGDQNSGFSPRSGRGRGGPDLSQRQYMSSEELQQLRQRREGPGRGGSDVYQQGHHLGPAGQHHTRFTDMTSRGQGIASTDQRQSRQEIPSQQLQQSPVGGGLTLFQPFRPDVVPADQEQLQRSLIPTIQTSAGEQIPSLRQALPSYALENRSAPDSAWRNEVSHSGNLLSDSPEGF